MWARGGNGVARGCAPIPALALALGAVLMLVSPAGAVTFTQFTSANLGGDDAPCWTMDGSAVFYSSRVFGLPYIYRKQLGDAMGSSGTRVTAGATWGLLAERLEPFVMNVELLATDGHPATHPRADGTHHLWVLLPGSVPA